MSVPARSNRMSGVRLGELERSLLCVAPQASDSAGMLIEDPGGSRSTRQGYLRAAKKLEQHGLIERRVLRVQTRAFDPRRTRPLYRRGRFHLPPEALRRHSVRRVLIWITPFGEGIRRVYRAELTSGRSIRWTNSKVFAAEAYEYHGSQAVQGRFEEIRDRLAIEAPEAEPTREAVPPGVGSGQLERWHAAIALARRHNPTVGSERLWSAAVAVFESSRGTDQLGRELGGRWRSPKRADPLRLYRSQLGLLFSRG